MAFEIESWPVDVLADYTCLVELLIEYARVFGYRTRVLLVMVYVTVLHAFIKKTSQTPDRELRLARSRLKEVKNG